MVDREVCNLANEVVAKVNINYFQHEFPNLF